MAFARGQAVKGSAIFVLSGGLLYRAEEAGKVFRMGYAPEVWLSRPVSPSDELERLGIHYVEEEEYSRQILIHEGVPEDVIHILREPIVDTEEEVAEAVEEMRQTGKTKVLVVSSPLHTRRVRALWNKLAGSDLQLLVHGAHDDPADIDHWWRNTRDVSSVMHETMGLLNVWAGLPVRPSNLQNNSSLVRQSAISAYPTVGDWFTSYESR